MTIAFIITIVIACILLFLLILQRKELRSISSQLKKILNEDTNKLISSQNGTADKLILEINALLKELRETKIKYGKKNHELEQMMTNISHDLRTPLTSAMGYIELIQHSQLTEEERQRELAVIEKRLRRLEELINSFFEFSQIVSSGRPPERSRENIVFLLQEAIVHYYDDYRGAGRRINFYCDCRRLDIFSNGNMLMRIFDNLIGNALKHCDGDLTITAKESKDNIRIIFQNNIDDKNIDTEHIFDEFYTTDISRTKGSTGLGLAIAKQFTEMLGGKISAEIVGNDFVLSVYFEKIT